LLDPKQSGTFLKQLDQWVQRIADAGFVNSLAQVLIKVAVPGVPDFYQGTEYWDFHLVDPDNRRPVDYHARSLALAELQQQFESNWHAAWQQLLTCWPDDRIKLFTVWQCLAVRQRHRQVFESGDYLPLKTTGDRAQHVLAWARRFQDTWVIAATTLRPEKLSRWDFEDTIRPTQPRAGLPKFPWGATRIELPAEASPVWTNAFSHQQHHAIDDGDKSKHVPVSDLLSDFPIALLCSSDAG
jgi:(1->4)-alpha-D-glucan 1-alpha-D-glucosylmutase